jgi:hypothetical protein
VTAEASRTRLGHEHAEIGRPGRPRLPVSSACRPRSPSATPRPTDQPGKSLELVVPIQFYFKRWAWRPSIRCIERGLQLTEHRRIVLEVLKTADDHPRLREIHRRAADGHGIATIYRTLNTLVKARIAKRQVWDAKPRRSELQNTSKTTTELAFE